MFEVLIITAVFSRSGCRGGGGGRFSGKGVEKMKCDFCEKEFPESELETVSGALHDSGDPEEFHVCETCAAWLEDNTARRVEK